MAKNTYVLKRHVFYRALVIWGTRLYLRVFAHFHFQGIYKLKKHQPYLILASHQTPHDGLIIPCMFNRMPYIVGTETMMCSPFAKLLDHCFGVIPFKKGLMDMRSLNRIMKVLREGGNVILFPEGNRTYGEFQFPFGSVSKIARKLQIPVVLVKLQGGTSCYPRYAEKYRKGHFTGFVSEVLTYDDYKDLTDAELDNRIAEGIKSFDSLNGIKCKSNQLALYAEEEFFACPKCRKMNTLHSKGNYLTCSDCGLQVEFKDDLTLSSTDDNFKFKYNGQWYNYQKHIIKEYVLPDNDDDIIFSDEDVKFSILTLFKKRVHQKHVNIKLTKKALICGDHTFPIEEIKIASPINGKKLNICTTDNHEFVITGNPGFNPLKYVFMLQKLPSYMALNHMNDFYSLEDEKLCC